MPSKSKKYSRKRNYRKRRHSRRMQRKSRSRNAYAYNRRRRTMFGGAPDGVYIVTPINDNDANKQNLEQLVATGYAFKESTEDGSEQYYSTEKFNNDFQLDGNSKDVELSGVRYTITVTQTQDDNYNVNVKTVSDGVEKDDGNVTFTKVNDDTEQTRIQNLPDYKSSQY